jgi:exosortase A-associated hydrolase 1
VTDAAHSESALMFVCGGERLLGVVSRPPRPARAGIVIIVGGPQYRVGSHRQFLLLARDLARAGFAVMRFDYRGMGDSDGQPRSFEAIDDDIAAAIEAFTAACPEVTSVALWGLCDGASAALLYCQRRRDPRVHGLCLLNPWVRSEHTLARARLRHYYGDRLVQPDFWSKLGRGETKLMGALADLWHNWRLARAARTALASEPPGFRSLMAAGFRGFSGEILLILSGCDATAQEFLECVRSDPEWAGLLGRPHLQRLELSDADHTFSNPLARQAVESATRDWLARLAVQRGAA